MSSYPSGIVTFLFTDIEGSTKLAQQYPSQWETLRGRHHAILQSAMDAQNGYVFQIIGDAFCVAFASAIEALNAALDAQRYLVNEDWSPAPVKVRMGIHSGTAQLKEDGQYIGYAALTMTQRIMSAGHGGQVLLSGATRELVRDMLPADTSLMELGEKRLKDLQRPESLYQLSAPSLPAIFPPLKTLDSFPNNLPMQLTSFIGRKQEIAEVKRALDKHRLVTLTGPGGTGKTRLSLQASADSVETFKHGVWFVELTPLMDPDLIPQTILSTIGIGEQPGKTPLELLKEYLQGKITLIILDNCEHLIAGSARVANALLNAVSGLKILATSREALSVQGEATYPVPPLSLPDPKHLPVTEQVSQFEAVRLFIDRAMLVQPHFAVTNENAPAVAQICYSLDGIPLAIELAVARIKSLSPDQIARRLDDRFRLLTGGSRTALERHQTLRATLDWSYNLLSQDEKRLLCRLSVFAGGWALEAAERVCGSEEDGLEILDLLTQLVEKSLVNANISDSNTRYSMLETTRQYGHEKLFESSENEIFRQKHADYFLGLAEQADQEIHGAHQLEWIDLLEMERDNLRTALEWSLSAGQTERAARYFNALNWASYIRGHFSELNEWFETITALTDIENFPLQFAGMLTNIGIWEWLQPGKISDALSHLTRARFICLELGVNGERQLAWTLTWLCVAARMETLVEGTDPNKALGFIKEALQLHRKFEDPFGIALGTFCTGVLELDLNLPSAKQTLERSLDLYTQLGNSYGAAFALQFLGIIYKKAGDFNKAQKYLEQELHIHEKLGYQAGVTFSLQHLADLHRIQGDFLQAKQFFHKIIRVNQEYGLAFGDSLYGLAMIALAENDYASAQKLFTGSFEHEKNRPTKVVVCDVLMGFAAISAGLNQPERSAKLYGAAQAILDTIDYQYSHNDRNEFERHIRLARKQLRKRFEPLVEDGRSMTEEQAIAFVLEGKLE